MIWSLCRLLSISPIRTLTHYRPSSVHRRGFAGFPGVDGMFSETQESLSQSFAQDLSKFSKLRAIVLSVDVLTGGANSVVKPKAQTAAISSNIADPETPPVQHAKYDTSKEIEGVSDVKTKYWRKLQDKLNGGEHSMGAGGQSRGDAGILQVGRQIASAEDRSKAMAASAWMFAPGMGALLDYCHHRTLQVGLVPTFKTAVGLVDQFVKASSFTFAHVQEALATPEEQKAMGNDRDRCKHAVIAFGEMLNNPKFREILPKQILLVTSDDALLSGAKDMGFMTVKYRTPQGLYGTVSTDFSATSALEVQDALESLNGVAMRSSAFRHRAA